MCRWVASWSHVPLVEGGTDPLILAGHEILEPADPPDRDETRRAGSSSVMESSRTSPIESTTSFCPQVERENSAVVANAAVGYGRP